MAKDPAFLFYSSDFLTGTMLMSDEQVGQYMRLLCLQHQQGHLSEAAMLKVCGKLDDDILKKFKLDENGLYYNVRLEKEANRRNAYTESRRANLSPDKEPHMDTHMDKHMERHMENENENINGIRKSSTERIGGMGVRRPPKPPKKTKKAELCMAHGQYGWVKLTPTEYERLVSDLGDEEAKRCIRLVDESAQSTGNKNGWKDWNLTVRRCSRDKWGLSQKSGPKSSSFDMMQEYREELEGRAL